MLATVAKLKHVDVDTFEFRFTIAGTISFLEKGGQA